MNCKDCKFWDTHGECSRIPDHEAQKAGLPYVDGQGCYNGALITPPEFGCVLFEGTKKATKFAINVPRAGLKFLRIEMDGLLRSIEIGCNGTDAQARIVRGVRKQLSDHEKALK